MPSFTGLLGTVASQLGQIELAALPSVSFSQVDSGAAAETFTLSLALADSGTIIESPAPFAVAVRLVPGGVPAALAAGSVTVFGLIGSVGTTIVVGGNRSVALAVGGGIGSGVSIPASRATSLALAGNATSALGLFGNRGTNLSGAGTTANQLGLGAANGAGIGIPASVGSQLALFGSP